MIETKEFAYPSGMVGEVVTVDGERVGSLIHEQGGFVVWGGRKVHATCEEAVEACIVAAISDCKLAIKKAEKRLEILKLAKQKLKAAAPTARGAVPSDNEREGE